MNITTAYNFSVFKTLCGAHVTWAVVTFTSLLVECSSLPHLPAGLGRILSHGSTHTTLKTPPSSLGVIRGNHKSGVSSSFSHRQFWQNRAVSLCSAFAQLLRNFADVAQAHLHSVFWDTSSYLLTPEVSVGNGMDTVYHKHHTQEVGNLKTSTTPANPHHLQCMCSEISKLLQQI